MINFDLSQYIDVEGCTAKTIKQERASSKSLLAYLSNENSTGVLHPTLPK